MEQTRVQLKGIANVDYFIIRQNGASFGTVNVGSSKKIDIAQFEDKGQNLKALDDFIGAEAQQLQCQFGLSEIFRQVLNVEWNRIGLLCLFEQRI